MANVQLTGNFLATARCLIFADGGGITWTFNSNTNTLQASGSGGGVTGLATPTGKVGLTAVAGSLLTAMRSDGAPPIDQTIAPTWAGLHTFNAGVTVGGGVFTLSGHTLALSANATVGGTNTGDQVLPSAGNPGSSVGLSTVNGVAATFMRSDGAPALSQAIVPTWTGLHTFNTGVVAGAVTGTNTIVATSASGQFAFEAIGTSSSGSILFQDGGAGTHQWAIGSGLGVVAALCFFDVAASAVRMQIAPSTGNVTIATALGIHSNSPPAQVTGWGTPTGGTVVNNFAAGVGTSCTTDVGSNCANYFGFKSVRTLRRINRRRR